MSALSKLQSILVHKNVYGFLHRIYTLIHSQYNVNIIIVLPIMYMCFEMNN